jgi:hypothetical protein
MDPPRSRDLKRTQFDRLTAVETEAVPSDVHSIIQTRSRCPSYGCDPPSVLLREPFDGAALRVFLERQYAGRARLEQLRGYSYELDRCRNCQLAYQQPIPGPRLVHEIHENGFRAASASVCSARDVYDPTYWAQQIHFLIEHLRLRSIDLKVLDFRMGWSEWTNMARAFGCEVYGSELSPDRPEYAHSIRVNWVVRAAVRYIGSP